MTDQEFLAHFQGVKGSGPQYSARCPGHDDRQASLSIHVKEDGTRLVQCHAGCRTEDVLWAAGLTMQDLFGEPPVVETWTEVATYAYLGLDGKFAEKVRKESNTGKKSFIWRQPNDRGSWTFNRQGIGHVLYNHPALEGVENVFLVEGEKDVDTLTKHGLVAVCGADGAGAGKWRPEYTEQLRGKHVAIIPDNDSVGKAFAIEEAKALDGVAASVRIVDLATIWLELPEHGDVSDLVARDGAQAVEAVRKLANETELFKAGLVIHQAVEIPLTVPPSQTSQEAEPSKLVFYESVEYVEPEFLVKPYIPAGKITIIQGDSGIGKTKLSCKIAACVSRGMPIQNTPCDKGMALILSVEDDPETLRGKVEHGGIEMWQLLHMLERHLLKMNMVGSMLMAMDGTLDRALGLAKAVAAK